MAEVPHYLMVLANTGSAIAGAATLLAIMAVLFSRKNSELIVAIASAMFSIGVAFMVPAVECLPYGTLLCMVYGGAAAIAFLSACWLGNKILREPVPNRAQPRRR